MFEVICYPPPRPWWQFWRPSKPFLLRPGLDYRISSDGEEVEVYRPKRGYKYKVAFITGD